MAGEFKTVRKGHEMTNRKMFFTMLWGAVFRRRSRAVMAVIASMVGAATLFCLAATCIAVPQQMNEEMRHTIRINRKVQRHRHRYRQSVEPDGERFIQRPFRRLPV